MDIGVVIVTYNRIEELKKTLLCYENQIKSPKYLIIVNNNSNDGTREYLEEWKNKKCSFKKYIISLNENIGGSGGFYEGLKKAIELNVEWIWVADDDAYPQKDAFLNAEKFYESYKHDKLIAICGSVINNGKIDEEHRRRIKKGILRIKEKPVSSDEYKNNNFKIDLFSYVGTILNKNYICKYGLTEKNYFIYYDDTEHSLRLSKYGDIICVPDIKVNHDIESQNREEINWKLYYGIRNRMLTYKKHFPYRYFYMLLLKNKLKELLIKDSNYKNILKSAINDAKLENEGLHSIYAPGWKAERKKR